MKIIFALGWPDSHPKTISKFFKDANAAALFEKYLGRIAHEFSYEVIPLSFEQLSQRTGLIWVCERTQKSRMLSSTELTIQFQKICDSGNKNLTIWIGGPDGLSAKQVEAFQPDLMWSFGPLTLPHELAAVVAVEQIYRAIAILKNHPYHSGH